MRAARRYVVSGHVQGVGFRYYLEAAAAREGVHGWVRNRPDGSVEALIEGEQASIDRVEAALRRGPSGARVDEVSVADVPPTDRATGFSIR